MKVFELRGLYADLLAYISRCLRRHPVPYPFPPFALTSSVPRDHFSQRN